MHLIKQNFLLFLFALTKVPLMLFCTPKLISISEKSCHIKIPLHYFTKNHVNSMYFGALLVGVDLCCGLLAMHLIKKSNQKINIIFKDVSADFFKTS